ncbi:hypothetical protein RNJ44_00982 [Nakaseomyces bracarensis]|uniref:Uncharacterized protein n=1 Tax=Nakaseomyces bracarensis TaxID=273131 RepID=A0ABR4NQL7_9SACH
MVTQRPVQLNEMKVKTELDDSLKRKRPPPLEFRKKRTRTDVVVKYVGVRPLPLYVPQYVATPMFILPHGATITAPAPSHIAGNVLGANVLGTHAVASATAMPLQTRNKVVDVMTPTGEQPPDADNDEDEEDVEEDDNDEEEEVRVEEEEDEHSQLAIEEGALPTPHLTAGKLVNGTISINNHSFEFQFPSRGKHHDRKLFLSICNQVWSDRPE